MFKNKKKGSQVLKSSISKEKKDRKVPKKKKKLYFLIPVGLLVVALAIFGYYYYKTSKMLKSMGLQVSPIQIVQMLIKGNLQEYTQNKNSGNKSNKQDPPPELQKDKTGNYTNMLIAGIDTRTNSGLNNTDTIMVASYNHTNNTITLISIPRDTIAKMPSALYSDGYNHYNKINSVYGIAEKKKRGSGLKYLEISVEETLSVDIQYSALINYESFIDIVDLFDGIDVNVDNTFTDYRYPTKGGHKTIHFNAGPQTMDGKTALEYARSRKSLDNGEGSDFARAKRQQKVVSALKNKMLESSRLTDLTKAIDLLEILEKNVKFSNYNMEDIKAAYLLKDKISNAPIYSFVLDPSIAGYTILTTGVSNGYSIGPKKGMGKYEDYQLYVKKCIQYPEIYSKELDLKIYAVNEDLEKKYENLFEKEFPYRKISSTTIINSEIDKIYILNRDGKKLSPTIQDNLNTFLIKNSELPIKHQKPEELDVSITEDVNIIVGSHKRRLKMQKQSKKSAIRILYEMHQKAQRNQPNRVFRNLKTL